jgi:hypothetical protein
MWIVILARYVAIFSRYVISYKVERLRTLCMSFLDDTMHFF